MLNLSEQIVTGGLLTEGAAAGLNPAHAPLLRPVRGSGQSCCAHLAFLGRFFINALCLKTRQDCTFGLVNSSALGFQGSLLLETFQEVLGS